MFIALPTQIKKKNPFITLIGTIIIMPAKTLWYGLNNKIEYDYKCIHEINRWIILLVAFTKFDLIYVKFIYIFYNIPKYVEEIKIYDAHCEMQGMYL